MAGFAIPLTRWYYQGQPAAGGKIHVFEEGGTTYVTIYSDGDLSSPAANPLTLDSNGEAKFYVEDSVPLRFTVFASDNSLIADLDPVYPVPDLTNISLNAHGQCRLTKSSTNLLLSPLNGNKLVINGQGRTIPSGGITLAASALSPDTLYYIYAYMDASVMRLEASATVPTTSTDNGVEIKTGDASRTLVGMARTITGPAWADTDAQRFVLSYFNRRGISGSAAFTTSRTTASGTLVEVNTETRAEFLTWGDEALNSSIAGIFSNTSTTVINAAIAVDGSAIAPTVGSNVANEQRNYAAAVSITLSRGYHYTTIFGSTASGTVSFSSGRNTVLVQG